MIQQCPSYEDKADSKCISLRCTFHIFVFISSFSLSSTFFSMDDYDFLEEPPMPAILDQDWSWHLPQRMENVPSTHALNLLQLAQEHNYAGQGVQEMLALNPQQIDKEH